MIRKIGSMAMVAVLLVVPALPAQEEDKDKPKPATLAEEYRAILKEFQTAQQNYFKELQGAQTNAERQEASKNAPKPQEFAPRFLALAKREPNNPAALDSLLWIAQYAGFSPAADEAVAILTDKHIESARLEILFHRQGPGLSPAMEKLALGILEKSPQNSVKRQACMALALQFKNRRQTEQAEKYFQRIVDEFPDVNSLIQVIQNNPNGPSGEHAISALIKDHMDSPGISTAIQRATGGRLAPGVEKLFRAVIEKSDKADAKGHATFGLAQYLKNQLQLAQALAGADETRITQYEGYYGPEIVQTVRSLDPEAVGREIEKLLEQVIEDYADVRGPQGKLGDAAKPDLFEIRFLSVGKQALDIEAEDIDGETFKLSDYRGKVVMLDFWGHW